jgi:hypothetical protein
MGVLPSLVYGGYVQMPGSVLMGLNSRTLARCGLITNINKAHGPISNPISAFRLLDGPGQFASVRCNCAPPTKFVAQE